jgi:glycosyltransferase involved in cell wall biosynthesis
MFVGGFGHTPNVGAAEYLVHNVFPLVRAEIGGASVVIAGSNMPETIRRLDGDGINTVGWLSDDDLDRLYTTCRVAAVPLLVGAGVKLKVVEAMAKGLPLVTTSVGVQGLPGLEALIPICNTAQEIADAIVRIIRMSDEEWLNQSTTELRYVREHFSRDAMKRSLTSALDLAQRTAAVE